jgi:hypothetical protein
LRASQAPRVAPRAGSRFRRLLTTTLPSLLRSVWCGRCAFHLRGDLELHGGDGFREGALLAVVEAHLLQLGVLVEAQHELADELLVFGDALERDFHRLFGVGALAQLRACEVAPLRRVLAEVLEQLQPAAGVFLGVLERR